MWCSLHKNPRNTGFRELVCWWTHSHARNVVHPNSIRTEAPVCLYLAVHLYFLSYHLLYNIPVNVFPWVLWVVLTNYETWGGVVGTPIDSWSIRSTGDILGLDWYISWRAVLWDWPLNLWDLTLTPSRQCQLNCRTVSWCQRIGQCGKKSTHLVAWSVTVLVVESKGTQWDLLSYFCD